MAIELVTKVFFYPNFYLTIIPLNPNKPHYNPIKSQ